jgi:glycosyltransferase involved in cell wall biosynthesis
VRDDLVEQYGLDPDRIAVINVPPATAAYPEPSVDELEATRHRLQLPERFIYYPAQTWPHKNHRGLFRALGLLRRSGLAVPLVCSGHPNEHQRATTRAARDAGVADLVTFAGFLPPLDVMALYRLARAIVFPSLYEGWGLPILEAFRANLPVACSSVTSLPELVGDAALVFDPHDERAIADAVHAVWADDARREILAERGRRRAECFSWDRVAMTLRAHYRHVTGRTLDERDQSLLAAESRV